MEYNIGDIVRTKKQHPCGSKLWEITRVGVDFKLKCLGCGHVVVLERQKALKAITKKIEKKRPKTKIYIESIYPINNTNSEKINHGMVGSRKNSTIKKINKEIKDYCNENDYTYIDVYNNLTDKNGNLKLEYTEEGLHLSSLGYIKVTKILYPYLGDTN